MRKNISIFLIILCTFIIQTSLMRFLPFIASPNLLIILVCSFGFMRGKKSGLLIGFVCGILSDLFYGNTFGLTALIYMYLGYISGNLYKVFFDKDVKIPMLTAGIADLIYNLVYYVAEFALRGRFAFGSYFRYTILPEFIATAVFTILFYKIYYALNQRISAREMEDRHSPWLRR